MTGDGYPIQDRCSCGPQDDERVRFHRRGGSGCRAELQLYPCEPINVDLINPGPRRFADGLD